MRRLRYPPITIVPVGSMISRLSILNINSGHCSFGLYTFNVISVPSNFPFTSMYLCVKRDVYNGSLCEKGYYFWLLMLPLFLLNGRKRKTLVLMPVVLIFYVLL